MNHSTTTPTKAEREWLADITDLGCVACAHLQIWCVCDERHHILRGGKRMGHFYTIPLCRGHHRGEWRQEQLVSISDDKLVSISSGRHVWNAQYPTEQELWERCNDRLHAGLEWPESKVLPRNLMEPV